MSTPKYLLVVNHVVSSVFNAVEVLQKDTAFKDLQVLIITNNQQLAHKYADFIDPSKVIMCNFSNSDEITNALAPFKKNIVGVICRGDKHIQYLREIIPLLPKSVPVASVTSLEASTNKRLMRQTFQEHYPEITPKFIETFDSSDDSINHIETALNYPLIIKPANLFSSLLIQACNDQSELQVALKKTFLAINAIYNREGIKGTPQVIVEEFLEGDFYSMDAFVLETGEFYLCPLVGYIPAKQLGIDDFFLYKRFIPTDLSQTDIDQAFQAAKKAMLAVKLKYSAAHIELIKTKNGWKVIELGPRLGRFRNIMYRLSYDIDLSLNDMKVHLGIKPEIPTKLQQFCAAYSIYPLHEGTLVALKGIKHLKNNDLVKSLRVLAKPGDKCLYAKNGGHALAEFIIASDNQAKYEKMVEFIEENIYANID